jgi:transcriptional regulatory protein LevR
VYKVNNCFILHNSDKEFTDGHTHLDSIKQAKLLIQLSLEQRVPNHLSRYLLVSLKRVNKGKYVNRIDELLVNKKRKQQYYNRIGV